ncbi:uncharacterized protein METZ01_LOCUS78142 [marine metagenome]|uniref:Metal-dependent hydrolase n=1 Tax=marine metagenome TaxID=408172 RepID=A0A381UCF5_9ZZZZ
MKNQSKSPKDHSINIRKPNFNLEKDLGHDWFNGSPFNTAFENSFSLLFPLGEKAFIESVKHFEKEIEDPKLLQEIYSFYGQEAAHRKYHQKYNELLCELRGYDLENLTKSQVKRHQHRYSQLNPYQRLASTVAAEHLTAIFADDLLRDKNHFVDSGKEVAKLWYWHALEETEHKAVAFDVYEAVEGHLKMRRRALLLATYFILKDTFRGIFIMLKQDGQLMKIKTWIDAVNFLFIKPGILRRSFIPWLQFFKKDFHPWQTDNRELIEEWKESIPVKN